MYFVYTRRRDSEGRLIEGQWMGINGWRQGLKGPLTKSEAQKIKAQVGAEIIPVEVDDFDRLILKAFEKVDAEPPEDLFEELADEEVCEECGRTLGEDEEDPDLPSSPTEASQVGSPKQEEPDLEETIQPETTPDDVDEEENGRPEWPGYNEAIEIMNDHDFDWMDVGGGRKTANVKDAWEEFASRFE